MKTDERDIAKVEVWRLTGQEWAALSTLAQQYDVSKSYVAELLARLQRTHEVRVLEIAPRVIRINVLDFRRALLETCSVQPGICKGL